MTINIGKENIKMNGKTKKITVSSVMIALGAVLSFVRVMELPLGGSVTLLSMLPICMISICYGNRWGVFCSFLYVLLQIVTDAGKLMGYGMTPVTWIACLVFDYIIAFGVLGFSGMFRKRGTVGQCVGIAVSLVIRFVSHFISGAVVFGAFAPEGWNVYVYSLCYNGSYMLPELLFTLIGAVFLLRLSQIKQLILKEQ